jgi:hypothetical protein
MRRFILEARFLRKRVDQGLQWSSIKAVSWRTVGEAILRLRLRTGSRLTPKMPWGLPKPSLPSAPKRCVRDGVREAVGREHRTTGGRSPRWGARGWWKRFLRRCLGQRTPLRYWESDRKPETLTEVEGENNNDKVSNTWSAGKYSARKSTMPWTFQSITGGGRGGHSLILFSSTSSKSRP